MLRGGGPAHRARTTPALDHSNRTLDRLRPNGDFHQIASNISAAPVPSPGIQGPHGKEKGAAVFGTTAFQGGRLVLGFDVARTCWTGDSAPLSSTSPQARRFRNTRRQLLLRFICFRRLNDYEKGRKRTPVLPRFTSSLSVTSITHTDPHLFRFERPNSLVGSDPPARRAARSTRSRARPTAVWLGVAVLHEGAAVAAVDRV